MAATQPRLPHAGPQEPAKRHEEIEVVLEEASGRVPR